MENKIPKLVHLTYKSENELPDHWRKSLEKWKDYGWEVMFHTDEDNDNLIKNDYPWLLEKYNNFKYFISKVDLARVCYLHKWGGVYSDLDLRPSKNFYDEIKNEELCFCESSFGHNYTNEFMCGEKGHPFWIDLMNEIKVYPPWWAFTKHFKVMSTSGPFVLDGLVKKTKYNYKILGNDWISCNVCSTNKCKIGKLIKVEGQSWNSWDSLLLNKLYCYRFYLMILFIFFVIYVIKKIRR